VQVPQELMTLAETPLFIQQAAQLWSDAEREEFVTFIACNPTAGNIIRGTGGVRKVRWSGSSSGKRGGVRVIYYYQRSDRPLYLLMVYAKARQESLTPEQKRAIRKLAAILKS
jgi:hypothetical protein